MVATVPQQRGIVPCVKPAVDVASAVEPGAPMVEAGVQPQNHWLRLT